MNEVGVAIGDGGVAVLNCKTQITTDIAHFALCFVELDVGWGGFYNAGKTYVNH